MGWKKGSKRAIMNMSRSYYNNRSYYNSTWDLDLLLYTQYTSVELSASFREL
nr:hypothetical protein Q903MT_gene2622 [Picea sitchensis]